VKSYKAKGKRLTTFEVETINELDPVRFKKKEETPTEDGNGGGNDEEDGEELSVDNDTPPTDPAPTKAETPEQKTHKTHKEKTEKESKANSTETVKNDSVLPDEIVDNGKIIDDITGQLTLF
jgi:topoisomerase-4 subunit A